jgi:hypothetical protein
VHTSSLDLLERSELPPAQARAILRVMEMELVSSQSALATRADMAAESAKLRAEMAAGFAEIRAELAKIHGKIEAGDARTQSRLAVWVLTCTFSQTVVLLGVIYFLFAHFVK